MIPDKEIKRYLNNQMSKEEHIAFEKTLEKDNNLQEEVDFQREMYAFFEQRENTIAFKGLLDNAEALHIVSPPISESKKKPPLYLLWILIGIMLVISSIFYFRTTSNSKLTDTNFDNKESTTTVPIESNISEKSPPISKENTKPTNETPAPSPTNSTPLPPSKSNTIKDILDLEKEPKEPNTITEPIADASVDRFSPSPFLESFIDKNVRANQTVTLSSPSKSQTFTLQDDSIIFNLKGKTNEEDPVLLSVYDNDPDNFDNDHKELNVEIFPTEDGEDNYMLNFKAKIPFAKGLYYIVIRNKRTNDILYLNKFLVR